MANMQSPQLTQAVLGIPFKLDGRPWAETIAEFSPETVITGSTPVSAHNKVSVLLEECGIDDPRLPVNAAAEVRSTVLEHHALELRRIGRVLIRAHNAKRLYYSGQLTVGNHTIFSQMNAGKLAVARPEEDSAVLTHLRTAGYFGDASKIATDLGARSIVSDAAEYLDLYPPLELPKDDELTLNAIAGSKKQTIASMRALAKERREQAMLRRLPNGTGDEGLYYKLKDFADVPEGTRQTAMRRPRAPVDYLKRTQTPNITGVAVPIPEVQASLQIEPKPHPPKPKGLNAVQLAEALHVPPSTIPVFAQEGGHVTEDGYFSKKATTELGKQIVAAQRDINPGYRFGVSQVVVLSGWTHKEVISYLREAGHIEKHDMGNDIRFVGDELDVLLEKLALPEEPAPPQD